MEVTLPITCRLRGALQIAINRTSLRGISRLQVEVSDSLGRRVQGGLEARIGNLLDVDFLVAIVPLLRTEDLEVLA